MNIQKPARLENLISDAARLNAETIALVFREEALSFKNMEERADMLSREILRQAFSEPYIAVSCTPSVEMIVSVLAILKAGKAFVPLDPKHPQSRLRDMVEEGHFRYILSNASETDYFQQTGLSVIANDYNYTAPEITGFNQNETAYVIFTSGSTGKPKGVMISHNAIINYVKSAINLYGSDDGAIAGSFLHLSLAFDASLTSVFVPLCSGKLLVINSFNRLEAFDDPNLVKYAPYNFIKLTPVQFMFLHNASDKRAWHSTKTFVLGGESLHPWHFAFLKDAGINAQIVNEYGPTEATVGCMVFKFSVLADYKYTSTSISIGKPMPGVQLYVLDDELKRTNKGQLYIGGVQLFEGYLNNPDLTSRKRIPNPFDQGHSQLYASGDLVSIDADGDFNFIGRVDDQVKIRGNRIELGDIAHAIMQMDGIQQVHVMVREDSVGQKNIVAYIVSEIHIPDAAQWRQMLEKQLPDFMLPDYFVNLNELPVTPNGKVDQSMLPKPQKLRSDLTTLYRKPKTEIERNMASVWTALTQLDELGTDDNFFQIGGNSLLVQKCLAEFNHKFQYRISITRFYQSPTISALAEYIKQGNQQLELAKSEKPNRAGSKIAIIGMSGKFPGADNVDEFWYNLLNEKETITTFSRDELDPSIPDEIKDDPNYVPVRGVINNAEMFDAAFFGITPSMARLMDPQQRIFLELAWEALEHGNCIPSKYSGRIGVYAGTGNNTYYLNNVQGNKKEIDKIGAFQVMTLNEKDYIASRTAYQLNLKGPAVSVYSACSTSLLAIAEAVNAIRSGQCDVAIAGGASITSPVNSGQIYQEGAMFSHDGRTRAFDEDSSGTVFSDGAAAVLLKPLDQAITDGDHIFAVISGVGVSNDGGGKGSFTAPSSDGQAAAIRMAINDADADPTDITYIEAHGTATPLGDPIEIEGLNLAFGQTSEKQYCAIGSVKSNIGHLTTAAGVAGVIKTALSLKHRIIPKSLGFKTPNPNINFSFTPFYVNTKTSEWKIEPSKKRIAGVSSFGVGGTNVHILLEEFTNPESEPAGGQQTDKVQLVAWSAKSAFSLNMYAKKLSHYVSNEKATLPDIANTLRHHREDFTFRRFAIARNKKELVSKLSENAALETPFELKAVPDGLVWLFPGQGSQFVNMGIDLYKREAVYRNCIDECSEKLRPLLGIDLRTLLFPAQNNLNAEESLRNTRFTQPAIFVTELALAKLWMHYGLMPDLLCGHSIGEIAAAHLAGVFSLDDALTFIANRGILVSELPRGSMLSVRLTHEKLLELLPKGLSIAAINSKHSIVVAGEDDHVADFARKLDSAEVPNKLLNTSHAFHSHLMEPALKQLEMVLDGMNLQAPQIDIISTVSGQVLSKKQATDPKYWSQHLLATVRFSEAMDTILYQGRFVYQEIGPGNVCTNLLKQHAAGNPIQAIAGMDYSNETEEDPQLVLETFGTMWLYGVPFKWEKLFPDMGSVKLNLPVYAFDRKPYWIKSSMVSNVRLPDEQIVEEDGSSISKSVDEGKTRIDVICTKLKSLCSEASGSDLSGSNNNLSFIELGLDSLLLTQLSVTIRKKFGIQVTFRQLNLDVNTFDKLSSYLDSNMATDTEDLQNIGIIDNKPNLQSLDADNSQNSVQPLAKIKQNLSAIKLMSEALKENLKHSNRNAIQEAVDAFNHSLESVFNAELLAMKESVDFVPDERSTNLTTKALKHKQSNVFNASEPPIAGAKLGRDENGIPAWYISDDSRPGKFLKLILKS